MSRQSVLVSQMVRQLKAKKDKKQRINKIDKDSEREGEAIRKLRQML